MQRSLLIIIALLLGMTLAWMLLVWEPEADNASGVEIEPAPKGGDFTLESYHGAVSLTEFRGSIVLLYFGYTWCPDICPTNLSLIGAVLDEMSAEERARVQPIFISVDPARDSVDRLKEYVQYFHPKLLGLTAGEQTLAEVATRYGAAFKIHAEDGQGNNYVVDHSADTYLIGADGALVKAIPHGVKLEVLLNSIRELL